MTLLRNERKRVALLTLAAALCSACGLIDAPGKPTMLAHRFGDGYWPENSRTGLRGAISRGFSGVEFDIGLTKDRVPVVQHNTSVDTTLCTRADGASLAGVKLYVKDLTLAELRTGFLCGGVPDPEFPDAQVLADTILTFDEVIQEVQAAPGLTLQFDVKYEPGESLDAEAFATEIVGRWRAANLPNRFYTSCAYTECVQAFRAQGVEDARLTWPNFVEGSNTTLVGVGSEVLSQLGLDSPIGKARSAGATGLDASYAVLDRRSVEAANKEGLKVTLWTVDSESALSTYCQWPVDVVISDYLERSPCR